MNMQPTRVIYISGSGRSGTTVLNDILDTINGVSAFGEIWGTWASALDLDHLCGCGLRFAECTVWSAVAGEHISRDEIKETEERLMATCQIRRVWRESSLREEEDLVAFSKTVGGVYRSLATATGASTIVDSSKTTAFALLAGSDSSVDMRIVHIIRDPRAVVASWSKQKAVEYGTHVASLDARKLSGILRRWIFFNTVGLWRLKRRYPTLVIKMEDLVADPASTLDAVRVFAEVDRSTQIVNDDGSITIGGAHSVSGNPGRFAEGPTQLRAPETWRTSLPLWKRTLVTVVTFPVMLRYGYRIWAKPASRPPT
jgi:sulfotransferase family protein